MNDLAYGAREVGAPLIEVSCSISGDTLSYAQEVNTLHKSSKVNDLHLNLNSSASNSPKPDFVARIRLHPSCNSKFLCVTWRV